jgi:hypothetical protein
MPRRRRRQPLDSGARDRDVIRSGVRSALRGWRRAPNRLRGCSPGRGSFARAKRHGSVRAKLYQESSGSSDPAPGDKSITMTVNDGRRPSLIVTRLTRLSIALAGSLSVDTRRPSSIVHRASRGVHENSSYSPSVSALRARSIS